MDKPASAAVAMRLRAIGISTGYASDLARGNRVPSDEMAIRIYRETGLRMGAIQNATPDEIETLARLKGVAA